MTWKQVFNDIFNPDNTIVTIKAMIINFLLLGTLWFLMSAQVVSADLAKILAFIWGSFLFFFWGYLAKKWYGWS